MGWLDSLDRRRIGVALRRMGLHRLAAGVRDYRRITLERLSFGLWLLRVLTIVLYAAALWLLPGYGHGAYVLILAGVYVAALAILRRPIHKELVSGNLRYPLIAVDGLAILALVGATDPARTPLFLLLAVPPVGAALYARHRVRTVAAVVSMGMLLGYAVVVLLGPPVRADAWLHVIDRGAYIVIAGILGGFTSVLLQSHMSLHDLHDYLGKSRSEPTSTKVGELEQRLGDLKRTEKLLGESLAYAWAKSGFVPADSSLGGLRRASCHCMRKLTDRQRQVLELWVQGRTYELIAREMQIGKAGVKSHLDSIRKSTQLSRASEHAVLLAFSSLNESTVR